MGAVFSCLFRGDRTCGFVNEKVDRAFSEITKLAVKAVMRSKLEESFMIAKSNIHASSNLCPVATIGYYTQSVSFINAEFQFHSANKKVFHIYGRLFLHINLEFFYSMQKGIDKIMKNSQKQEMSFLSYEL